MFDRQPTAGEDSPTVSGEGRPMAIPVGTLTSAPGGRVMGSSSTARRVQSALPGVPRTGSSARGSFF